MQVEERHCVEAHVRALDAACVYHAERATGEVAVVDRDHLGPPRRAARVHHQGNVFAPGSTSGGRSIRAGAPDGSEGLVAVWMQ